MKPTAEIAIDEDGKLLWIEPYIFELARSAGEVFKHGPHSYMVIAVSVSEGRLGGRLVEHVCRLVS